MVKELIGRLVPAESLRDSEIMRVIRNDCRQFMTRNTLEISSSEQQLWFTMIDRDLVKPFLFVCDDLPRELANVEIGYGLIRKIDDKWWVSGGLLSAYRRKGFGKQLFGALTDYVNRVEKKTSWLEVRSTNVAARRLYTRIGYEEVAFLEYGHWTAIIMKREV